jgi:uncharacterized protein
MPETRSGSRRCCAGCRKPLREGAHFCPNCGRTTDGRTDAAGFAVAEAAPAPNTAPARAPSTVPAASSAPALHQPDSVFETRWQEIKQVGWLFGLLLASSFTAGIVIRFIKSPWVDAALSGADMVLVMVVAGMHFGDVRPLFRPPVLDRRGALALTLLSFVFAAVMCVYFMLISWAGVPLLRVAGIYEKAGWHVASMFLLVSILPAVVEETAFRGIIQTLLQRIVGQREALFIQAALFSVLHLLPMMFISHFFMGLCFGYMRFRSKSLYPSMALHAAWNASVLCQELLVGHAA